MDNYLLLIIAGILVVLIAVVTWLSKSKNKIKTDSNSVQVPGGQVRRAAGVRGVRQRRNLANAQEQQEEVQGNDDVADNDDEDNASPDLSKVGAKKRVKLEEKAARKAQREVENRAREERKKKEQKEQEERDRQSAKEREDERLQEEAEKAAREEKERKEQQEYMKLKEAFSIEEEGFEEDESEENRRNLLQDFIGYIKDNKVVVLEDLAAHFNLKTSSAIDRIQQLQSEGSLSGVIDDRGKFIYISQQELEDVAKFVKQRGRVSIVELVEHSNDLINLNPAKTTVESC